MFHFLHTFLPQPILWQWGALKIYWYGLLVVAGIIAGLTVVLRLGKKQGIKADDIFNLAFYLVIFSLIGARIYAVFLNFGFYLKNPGEIIAVWHGGLAIHGAIIGGILTLLIYSWQHKQSFWLWADLIAPALAIGQAFGRFGNYFNQEIFGKPTNLPWGIPIAWSNRPFGYLNEEYFHPTFFYESMLDLVNFLLLLVLFFWLSGRIRNQEIKKSRNQGVIFLVYLINYSLIRILMEFLRVDVTPEVFGVRWPVVVSVFILLGSLVVIFWRRHKAGNNQ